MTDILPNPLGLFQHGDNVVITTLADNTFSTLINVNLLNNEVSYIDIGDISFSHSPNAIIDDKIYIYIYMVRIG